MQNEDQGREGRGDGQSTDTQTETVTTETETREEVVTEGPATDNGDGDDD
jgi:hypothetical protein